jgi:hypothetical protein
VEHSVNPGQHAEVAGEVPMEASSGGCSGSGSVRVSLEDGQNGGDETTCKSPKSEKMPVVWRVVGLATVLLCVGSLGAGFVAWPVGYASIVVHRDLMAAAGVLVTFGVAMLIARDVGDAPSTGSSNELSGRNATTHSSARAFVRRRTTFASACCAALGVSLALTSLDGPRTKAERTPDLVVDGLPPESEILVVGAFFSVGKHDLSKPKRRDLLRELASAGFCADASAWVEGYSSSLAYRRGTSPECDSSCRNLTLSHRRAREVASVVSAAFQRGPLEVRTWASESVMIRQRTLSEDQGGYSLVGKLRERGLNQRAMLFWRRSSCPSTRRSIGLPTK